MNAQERYFVAEVAAVRLTRRALKSQSSAIIPFLRCPTMEPVLSKHFRDFEVSSLGILVFRGTFRPIWPNFDLLLTNSDLFWPISRADLTYFHLFRPVRRVDLTYFHLFRPITFHNEGSMDGTPNLPQTAGSDSSHFKSVQRLSRGTQAAIVELLTCPFTVVAFCSRCKILQMSSFHGCWLTIVVVWRSLWVRFLPLDDGQVESRHFTVVTTLGSETLNWDTRKVVVLWLLWFHLLFSSAPKCVQREGHSSEWHPQAN